MPTGATASLNPASVAPGASSTLTLNPGAAASGSYPITITDASDPTVTHSVGYTLAVDRPAPTAHLTAPSAPVVVGSSAPVSWTSSDAGSGVAGVDVRFVRARWSGGFGAWPATPQWRNLAATGSKPAALRQGYTTCFEGRAHDAAGNTGAWSAMRCVAAPLDDRALSTSAGLTRMSGSAYWNATATRRASAGKTLSLAGAVVDRIGIVATRCPTCGSVRVLIGRTVIGTIDLSATRAGLHMFLLPPFALRTGTVVLKTLSAKTVLIDGLAVTRA